jgi:hypothetical protein
MRVMRRAGHVARMGERRGAYRVLLRRPEGKRPFERPRRRREDNIEVSHQGARWGHKWIYLFQDRDMWRVFVNSVMNLEVYKIKRNS